jgi:hypothetical protein
MSTETTGITYEKLMKSGLMRYPNHSPIVHAIFNPFVTAVIMFVAIMAYVVLADGDWEFAVIVACLAAFFMSMKIAMVGMFLSGHGVGIIKKGKFSVLGLPTVATVILSIPFLLLVFLTYLSFTAPDAEMFGRLRIFCVSFLFGFIVSLLSWRFHTYYETWYGDEYAARMEFKGKGYSDDVIEEKLQVLRNIGILDWKA